MFLASDEEIAYPQPNIVVPQKCMVRPVIATTNKS